MNRKLRELLIEEGVGLAKFEAIEREKQDRIREILGPQPKRRRHRFDSDPSAEDRFVIEGASFRPRS